MFRNLLSRLSGFMFGRYGSDQLTYALLILSLILYSLASFFKLDALSILPALVLALAIFRMLSKNLDKRRRENQGFLNWFNPLRGWFKDRYERLRTSKTHKYFKCPSCRVTVRVPKGKGSVNIICPKCKGRFRRKT